MDTGGTVELKGSLKKKYRPRNIPVIVTQQRKDWYVYIRIDLSDCDIELLESESYTYHGQAHGYHVLQLAADTDWRYRQRYEHDIETLLDTLQDAGALEKT